MAFGHEHTPQPVLVLREGLHLAAFELDCADQLAAIEGGDQMREAVGILHWVEPLQFLFQRQAGVAAPLRVIPLRQLLPFRCPGG
ncbi:hypothetical protein G6F22_021909 [Rhizopus arrhizus]|nr:hypothetical protein G6F22_021909 [Rhizopus arrhizus]